jgi:hypothetical protein
MRTELGNRTLVALSATTLFALTLAGCQTTANVASTEDSLAFDSVASEETVEGQDAPTSVDSLDEALQELPDWTLNAPAEGSDAALAWEALMGPEGEFAALASYQAVLDEYGDVEPYATIMQAEARHADALIRQLGRMGVDTPEENPYLGLIAAPADLTTAAEAWAEGEVANVELYDRLLADATDEGLIRVFENLRRASAEQHLPAFERAAENGGTLDAEEMTGLHMMNPTRGEGNRGGPNPEDGSKRQRGHQQESKLT